MRRAIVALVLLASLVVASPAQAGTHTERHCRSVTTGVRVCETYHYSSTPHGIRGNRLVLSSNHCSSIRRFFAVGVWQRSRSWDQRVLRDGGCRYSRRVGVWTRGNRARVDVGAGVALRGVSDTRSAEFAFHVCRGGGC